MPKRVNGTCGGLALVGRSRHQADSTIHDVGLSASVIGVHLAAGVAWLAPASAPGDLVSDLPDRLEIGAGVGVARGLAEFEESFRELLRTEEVDKVALLKPGSSRRPPRPSISIQRGRIEGAIFIATSRAPCELHEISHQAVEKLIGVRPTDGAFSDLVAERLTRPVPKRWGERAPAYGAALTALGPLA